MYVSLKIYEFLLKKKTKVMVFYAKQPIRSQLIMNDKPIEQVPSFMFLGCKLTYFLTEYMAAR
jgi:hypothetical protein